MNNRINEIKEKIKNNYYTAVLFDLDGTLVDSMWMWRDIDIEYLARFGAESSPELENAIRGMSLREVAVYFKETYQIPHTIDKIIYDWIVMSSKKYHHDVKLKPGVLSFINVLKSKGIKMGVGTSNDPVNAIGCLKANGVYDFFSCLGSSDDVEKGKPNPDIYLYVAGKLSADPKRCLCFDDLPEGIMAAKAAGMDCIAVYDSFSKEQDDVKKELADAFIADFTEML